MRSLSNDVYTTSNLYGEWTRATVGGQWSPRAYFGSVVFQEKVWVAGGKTDNGLTNSVFSWTGDTKDGWASHHPPLWVARYNFGMTAYEDALWVVGGQPASGHPTDDVWMSHDGDRWDKIAASSGIGGRSGLQLAAFMNRMWVVGGTPQASAFWSTNGSTWIPLPGAPVDEESRQGQAAAIFQNELWLVGGLVGTSTYDNSFYIFDPCLSLNCSLQMHNDEFVCTLPDPRNLSIGCVCKNGATTPDCSSNGPPDNTPAGVPLWLLVTIISGTVVVMTLVCWAGARYRSREPDNGYLMLGDGTEAIGEEWLIKPKSLKLEDKPIGAGGFAQVFRGKFRGTDVAVKQIHAYLMNSSDREVLYADRFKAEAAMMARLYHPNLQGLIGLCVQPSLSLVTEFAPHGSMADVMGSATGDMVAPLSVLKMMHQVASGVLFLHTRKPPIVHRDLNPNNVLVYDLHHDTLNVKVADFGLSKEVALEQTMTGFLGSPSYIAPEILTDSATYDEKVDVYGYGIMLWACARYLQAASAIEAGAERPPDEEFHAQLSPYRGMSPWQIVARVKDGLRPSIPPCNEVPVMRTLMQACWDGDAGRRPTFEQILQRMEEAQPTLRDPTLYGSSRETSMIPDTFIGLVAPGLMVSSLSGVRSASQLRRIDVTHILNTARRAPGSSYPSNVTTMVLNIDDEPDTDLLAVLPRAVAFIEKGRRAGGCLVHCLAGTSRSVSVCTAYLMVAYNMRDDAALQLVTERHPQARPNPGFRRQLYALNDATHPRRVEAEAALAKARRGRDLLPLINASMRRTALSSQPMVGGAARPWTSRTKSLRGDGGGEALRGLSKASKGGAGAEEFKLVPGGASGGTSSGSDSDSGSGSSGSSGSSSSDSSDADTLSPEDSAAVKVGPA